MYLIKILIKKFLRKIGWKLVKIRKPDAPNPYGKMDLEVLKALNESKGILHLGAHRGAEAEVYNWFGKPVLWFEANPEIYEELKDNLLNYSNQKCFNSLLSDEDDKLISFNISNYDSAASSIFEFSDEIKKSKIWNNRNHKMIKKIKLKSKTLDRILNENLIDSSNFNHWVLDLQGAELLALKGARKSLLNCKSLYIEVSNKEFYSKSATWLEVKNWLEQLNFYPSKNISKDEEDILFLKKINKN